MQRGERASHRNGPSDGTLPGSATRKAPKLYGERAQPSAFNSTMQLRYLKSEEGRNCHPRRGTFPPCSHYKACKSSSLLACYKCSTCPGRNRGKSSGLYSGCTCPRHRGRILFGLFRGPHHPPGKSPLLLRCTCPRHSRCKQKILVRCTCPQHRARILLGRFRGGYRANKRYRSRNHNFRRIF